MSNTLSTCNDTILACKDEQRRHDVREKQLNGLDYLEVSDDQLKLTVHFLGKAPEGLTRQNVLVKGGQRIRNIRVQDIEIHRQEDSDLDDCVVITVNKPGDFSCYTLCLVALDASGQPTDLPFPSFDPRYACIEFSFKEGCPSDLDCKPEETCPPEERHEPEIDYLAKDYASFRQLILDRLALIMPDWQERHVPDIGIALVELLAYVGDQLSYYQDAVATEAYLEKSRQRISVRRHARLVDYFMHEGCNARTWVCVETNSDLTLDPGEIYFVTNYPDAPESGTVLTLEDLRNIPSGQYEVFEPLIENSVESVQLYQAHNRIPFYTWGDKGCCLARGAISATLKDEWAVPEPPPSKGPEPDEQRSQQQEAPKEQPEPTPRPPERPRKLKLQPGNILIFEEVIGPKIGNPADADPNHRHVVRLTEVKPGIDELYDQPVVEIKWAEEDALPLTLCISAIGPAPECKLIEDISVACGNVILADHGKRIQNEPQGSVGVETIKEECGDECYPPEVIVEPGKFRPRPQERPLTFSQPLAGNTPASGLLKQDPRKALPWIKLTSIPALPDGSAALFSLEDIKDPKSLAKKLKDAKDPQSQLLLGQLSLQTKQLVAEYTYDNNQPLPDSLSHALTTELEKLLQIWTARYDLLESQNQGRHFVVEMDNDRRAHLRFGDGELGRIPDAGTAFDATYRVGNGPAGNVGAETIYYVVHRKKDPNVRELKPRNPLPAQGGTAPEPLEEVKLFAPQAFRNRLQRAVIAEDYARLSERNPKVQRAAAALRWTGSWYEVLVAIDPLGGVEANEDLLQEIKGYLYRYRRMGHDLVVAPAHYVALDIEMIVCVLPEFLRGHVKAALLNLFSNRTLPDGQLGFFHPDNLTFGEGIYLSKLIAAAQAVPGVESVTVGKLERLYEGPNHEIENGILSLGPLEVGRLDNDPSFPENGQLGLDMRGGR